LIERNAKEVIDQQIHSPPVSVMDPEVDITMGLSNGNCCSACLATCTPSYTYSFLLRIVTSVFTR